jgi:DNA polymerase III sliding clamp (beta) subunit (PCNA family)
MKLTISTTKLQTLLAKSVKGSSNNKMIPITGLMGIELKDGLLTLTTTDASNTLKVREEKVEGEDFYVVLQTDIFSKLVGKMTSEKITLKLKENALEVKGNGVYSIDLPLDEEGDLIVFPEIEFDFSVPSTTVNLTTIKSILLSNKASLAETMEIPCLTGYRITKGSVITTNTFKICANANSISDEDILMSAEMMELLGVMDKEEIKMYRNAGAETIVFKTNNVEVFGYELDEMDEYPLEAIQDYLKSEFTSMCKLPKDAILSVLDRLSLFIAAYQENAVTLQFNKDGVLFSTPKSKGSELINYQTSENFKDYLCRINVESLKTQVAANASDVIEIWYGHESALKLVGNKITQIAALMGDSEEVDG